MSAEYTAPPPANDRVADALIGAVIGGDLRIVDYVARGGTGTIYRAIQPSADRWVAVKILNARSSADDEAYRCFRNEVLSLARITHPHAVRLYEWGRAPNGHWYIVMELLEGRSLDEVLLEGPISPVRCLEILDDVAAVLEEAHAQGIVHRDIKPPNIFLQRVGGDEFVRLLDFGIARLLNQPSSADRPSGTPAYMAPEQIQGVEIDGRADIYALGVVAYECLGGRPPFSDGTPVTVLAKQVTETPKPLTVDGNVDVPPSLAGFIAQMLEKEPDRRPGTIREVRACLRAFRSMMTEPVTDLDVGPNPVGQFSRPRPAPSDAIALRSDPRPDRSHASWFGDHTTSVTPMFDDSRLVLVGVCATLIAVVFAIIGFTRGPSRTPPTRPAPPDKPQLNAVATATGTPSPPEVRVTVPPIAAVKEEPAAKPAAKAPPSRAPAVRNSTSSRAKRTPRPAAIAKKRLPAPHPAVALRACYELLSRAELKRPRLLIDGRATPNPPTEGCFHALVSLGPHTFSLVADGGVRVTIQRDISARTRGVFFLVE